MSDRNIEGIIANAINEQARGDPDALAARIVAALAGAGYRIATVNVLSRGEPVSAGEVLLRACCFLQRG